MPRVRSPKRGSRAFSPRKRAKNITGRIDFWPEIGEGPQLLGFAGYKAGMTHVFQIEDRNRAPDFGMELKKAATIIDVPPNIVVAVRAYEKGYDGLKALSEVWVENPPADLIKKVKTPIGEASESGFSKLEKLIDRIHQLRVIVTTQPRLTGVSKKKPDIMEIALGGGSIDEQFEYSKGLLGKTINISDVFSAGESIDIIGVTKGKGFQGPVKRWGIRKLQHKSRKTVRGVASIGPWKPRRVMHGVPRAGQMGFHNRTERNKRILRLGSDGESITPKGGFNNYGIVEGDYILLKGSVMGPVKRLVKLRKASRKSRFPNEPARITYINTEFLNQRVENK
jgi:large subunit ribosomal protein L3